MSETMGMTDKQFNAFIRFIHDNLLDAMNESNSEKQHAKLQKIIDNLQSIIED